MVDPAEPIEIAGHRVRNRLVMPPMVRNLATEDGAVTDELVKHYADRSKGGVGLIIVEAAGVALDQRMMKRNMGIHDDSMVEGLTQLADGIKEHGASAFIQINYAGAKKHLDTRFVGPSNIPIMKNKIPEPLSVGEIENIVKMFVDATGRAKEAGFDGVEIHGAHYYLLSAFLSSFTNDRTDAYGGSTEKKSKFSTEVIKAIRKELGSYPLIFRMNGIENVVAGISIEEGIEIAKIHEAAGADVLHVSCIVDETYNPSVPPRFTEETMPDWLRGFEYDSCIPCAAKIKPHVNVPVIGVGMVRDATLARSVLEDDLCDMLGIGRGLLADPDFVNKMLEGRDDEIVKWKD
jgi:2,4-dienoyl-CoA reductase-like NADH-dependent reductase (Old Yellow Enzyme family)